MDPINRPQIRLNLGSCLGTNAQSADRAFAPIVTNDATYFPFSVLFAKRMTTMIRASDLAFTPNVTNDAAYFQFSVLFAKRMTPMIRVHLIRPGYLLRHLIAVLAAQ